MNFKQRSLIIFFSVICVCSGSCKKGKKDENLIPNNKKQQESVAVKKKIVYLVRGTNFRLNYIDSNSVFKRGESGKDSVKYSFNKGSGENIGISIFKQLESDSIFYWEITINGKVQANAFSPGGAYMMIPYDTK